MADRERAEVRERVRARVGEVGERLGLRTPSDRQRVRRSGYQIYPLRKMKRVKLGRL